MEYLTEQYSEEFDIKFFRKGYKKKTYTQLDGSPIYYGKNKNIEEYLYEFSPSGNNEIVCYIAYWYNTKTNKSEIQEIETFAEIFNIFDFRKVSSYSQIMTWYNNKLKVKDMLENYLPNNYKIDLNYYSKDLIIKFEEKLKKVVIENPDNLINMYDNILKLEGCDCVVLKYKDYTIRFSSNYMELAGERFKSGQDIVEYLKAK